MALRLEAVGQTTAPLSFSYTSRDAILYALGVGARAASELDFLYEARGPRVLPTYAVVPAYLANEALFPVVGGDLLGVVHLAQGIRIHKPFAPSGTLTTIGRVAGIYDLKRLSQSLVTTETRDELGELVCETEWTILYRFDGDFGGPRPPKRSDPKVPARAADWTWRGATSDEQALLYRLSGDLNPLHADPATAAAAGFVKPLLHGLCTYGYVGRAVIAEACGGDASKLRALSGRFTSPVLPGDVIVVQGWHEEGRVLVRAVTERDPGEPVFGAAVAECA